MVTFTKKQAASARDALPKGIFDWIVEVRDIHWQSGNINGNIHVRVSSQCQRCTVVCRKVFMTSSLTGLRWIRKAKTLTVTLTTEQAASARDALSKGIYDSLFKRSVKVRDIGKAKTLSQDYFQWKHANDAICKNISSLEFRPPSILKGHQSRNGEQFWRI